MAATTKPSITLYRGFPGTGTYTWSPFVTKLETRLRFAGLSYRTEGGSPTKAPRGKIPYMAISYPSSSTPTMTSDSSVISAQLVAEGYAKDLNAGLSPAEKTQDVALRALLEDKLYFYQLWERWNENYYTMRSNIFGFMPYLLQVSIGLLAWRKQNAMLYGQGTGRFSTEEISGFRKAVWEDVDGLLTAVKQKSKPRSDEPFWILGGAEPSEADTTLFGFIVSALVCKA